MNRAATRECSGGASHAQPEAVVGAEVMAQRTPINPHSWTIRLAFDQAQLIEDQRRLLACSAQDVVDADGKPQHPGDMAAQLEVALDTWSHRDHRRYDPRQSCTSRLSRFRPS